MILQEGKLPVSFAMPDSTIYPSPVGDLYIEASDIGLTRVKFHPDEKTGQSGNANNPFLLQTTAELDEYFEGKRKYFDIKLDWSKATDFYKSVWSELLKIPYGKTVAYLDIAEALNNPKAVRAVGMANGKNPIPIIVPCHRVIGKSGHLHGFTGGLDIKEHLLHIENPKQFSIQKNLF